MKSFLFILILLAQSSFAGITMLQVEKTKDEDQAVYYRVTAWGLIKDGASKSWDFRTTGLKAKCDQVENCEIFDLKRSTQRFFVYFDQDGAPIKVDFHLEEPFEPSEKRELSEQALTHISALKAFLEAN